MTRKRSHIAILLRMRWRLLMSTFSGRAGRKAAAVLGFLMIAVWAVSFGVFSFHLIRSTQGWDAAGLGLARPAILRLICLVTFLLQLMTGVAFLAVSDFFDTSRLLHVPVRARSIFAAMLLSSVLSPSTLVFGSPAFGAIAALPGSLLTQSFRVVAVIGVLLFGQACSLFAGYLLLLALSRRRLRDLATVLGSVLGVSSYALIRLIGQQSLIREWVVSGPLWDALDFLPTSWFADLLEGSELSRWTDPRWLLPPGVALVASLSLGAWAFSRFYQSAGETSEADRTTRAAPERSTLLPAPVGAIMRQTFAITWREPQLKAMLFQQMVFLLIPMLTLSGGKGAAESAVWTIPFFIVFSHAWMALSLLGLDGSGLKLLLQSPARRSQILLGRVLAIGRLFVVIDVVAVGVMTTVMALVGGISDPWVRFLQMATACIIADGVMVSAGAFISVLAPFPLVRKSRSQRMRQEGCATHAGRAFLRMPVMFIAVGVGFLTMLPAAISVGPSWYAVTVPSGIAAVAMAAAFGIAAGARRLMAKEEEIVAALSDSGE